jgi:hypothetical protein
MVGFGPKQAWLAVQGGDASAIVAALGLRDLGEVDWRTGLDMAYLTDDRLVLTPPLPGAGGTNWVLVAGRWLLVESAVDAAALSAKLGREVQAFATYRTHEVHRWERALGGVLVRAFGFRGDTGEVTRWTGEPDAAERGIGLPESLDGEPDVLVGEADVLGLAGAWSIDPTTLEGQPAPGPLRVAAAT